MLKLGLFENHQTSAPDDYMATVQGLEIIDKEGILSEMIVHGGVTRTQAMAVFTARKGAIVLNQFLIIFKKSVQL